MHFIDLFGLAPGDPFKTMDKAESDVLDYIQPMGYDRPHRENGGLIYQDNDTDLFYATPPMKGAINARSVDPFEAVDHVPKNATVVAAYHNHYYGLDGVFSPEDKQFAYDKQLPLYMVGTPPKDRGKKKFIPAPKGTAPNIHLYDLEDPRMENIQ